MSRFSRFSSYVAAAGLIAAAGCASHFEPIMVTRDASAVASCQKVADIETTADVRYDDTSAQQRLEQEAREKGANTVLISDADARTGVAYTCAAAPSASSTGGNR